MVLGIISRNFSIFTTVKYQNVISLITLSFSAKILGIVCFSLLLIPIMVYAENYSAKIGNQTVTIIVKPSDVTVKPNYTVIVEPQNTTKLEQILQKLTENNPVNIGKKLDPLQALVTTEEKSWTEGDVLIASSTIFAFFSFGSFLAIRFENRRKEDVRVMFRHMRNIFNAIFGVQLTHIYIISLIMLGIFYPFLFVLAMCFTGVFLYAILRSVKIILAKENEISEKYTLAEPKIKEAEKAILQQRIIQEQIRRFSEEHEKRMKELEKDTNAFKSDISSTAKNDNDKKDV